MMDTGQTKLDIVEPFVDNNHQTAWVKTSKAPLIDDDNNIFGVLGIFEDISQVRLSRLRAQTGRRLFLSVILFGNFGFRREMEKKKEPQTSFEGEMLQPILFHSVEILSTQNCGARSVHVIVFRSQRRFNWFSP